MIKSSKGSEFAKQTSWEMGRGQWRKRQRSLIYHGGGRGLSTNNKRLSIDCVFLSVHSWLCTSMYVTLLADISRSQEMKRIIILFHILLFSYRVNSNM